MADNVREAPEKQQPACSVGKFCVSNSVEVDQWDEGSTKTKSIELEHIWTNVVTWTYLERAVDSFPQLSDQEFD